MAQLIHDLGDKKRAMKLGDAFTVIGRSEGADIVISDAKGISREHFSVHRLDDGTFTIRDLKSTNGTFLNGTQITKETPIHDGDRVRIGESTEFIVSKSVERHEAEAVEGIKVAGDGQASEAMSEMPTALEEKNFHALMADIIKDARTQPFARPKAEEKRR